ncbi:hypothetical protein D910_11189 [Dendroctonus ponderosae]|uniref:Vacuolar protein sorting-associated protein 16 homolog n=1 Tax=Dendroctonus ponderosae TaxID=77166 RepID=U4UN67_DENPD|nr:hypothetical protein D910_11189 [Dendroctonus ponderosae]
MSSALITANWFLLGRDLYFRRLEIYSMEWNQEIKLENFIVSSASYGGPLALRRDDRKITKVRGPGQPVISIFSGSGMTVTSFKWTQRPIVHMGWSNEEKLICIQDDGNVVVFNMFGKLFHKFNIFPKVHDAKIVDAKVFTNTKNVTGIAVMTSNFNIFIVNSIKDIKTRQLSDVPKSTVEPTCWEVVSEEFSTDVFFARGKELYRLKQDEHHTSAMLQPDISNPYSAILEMAVSLNARHLCFFTDSGHLWLGSTDLRHKYCEIETCGNETVVVYWEQDHTVLIVAKNGQFVQDTYDHAVHLLAEIDGVRIISSARHELLQKVPEVVQKIFRINSTEPGSFLLEASKQFQKGSHKANEYITLIKSKSSLEDAVNQCLDAVKYEFDTDIQKMLIRAAQFGKCFISGMNSHKYVKMCCLLRVLNAIRHFKVGQHQADEEIVAREIASKLGYSSGVSYREIAEKASEFGKNKLAIKLLEYESKASEQVELLLKLHENKSALHNAIESGDTDLIYMVVLKLREKMPLGDFKMTIRNFPVAQALYIKYCKEYYKSALAEIYIQEDDFPSQAQMIIEESLSDKNSHLRDSQLTVAIEAYNKGRKDLYASMCEETLKLSKFQRELEEKFQSENKFVGKSVHDTCKILLEMKDVKLAEKVKNDFKIPDKRYWFLRINTLAALKEWIELDKFAKLKKSPVGYGPFVDACWANHNKDEALKYMQKVPDDLKAKYYLKIDNETFKAY